MTACAQIMSSLPTPPNANISSSQLYPKPLVVSEKLNLKDAVNMEIILWPDNTVSVPIKALATQLLINVQQSENFKSLFFSGKNTLMQGNLNWGKQTLEWNHSTLFQFKHPLIKVNNSVLIQDDVYVDQSTVEGMLNVQIHYKEDEALLEVQTKTPPLPPHNDEDTVNRSPIQGDETTVKVEPAVLKGLVEKASLTENTQTQSQKITQSVDLSGNTLNPSYQMMVNHIDSDIQGSIWGQHYDIHPSLLTYKNKTNLDHLDWSIRHDSSQQSLVLGSRNIGLSALVAPSITIWGVELASKNASKPIINVNQGFVNTLAQGETAWSAFLGRTAPQFYPVTPDAPNRLFVPQSEKWLAGARYLEGITNRLTLGASLIADRILGPPKTYFPLRFPIFPDLGGFRSYSRDPNFFQGETAGLSLNYQFNQQWQLRADAGFSHYQLKPGSGLPLDPSSTGKALKASLAYQTKALSATFDLFDYDPSYYSPDTSRFAQALYDKRGFSTTINGHIPSFLNLNYRLQWEHDKTNLGHLLTGGLINANHWSGTLSRQFRSSTMASWNFNLIDGKNADRESLLKSTDLTVNTRLPYGLKGEVKLSHYDTNAIYLPGFNQNLVTLKNTYENNSVGVFIDVPLIKNAHMRIGNQLSSFVNYGQLQGRFQYKHIFIEPFFQKSYGSTQQLQDKMGCKVGYQWNNGASVSLAYYKLTNMFNGRALGVPGTSINSSEIYFEFSNVFGFALHRIHALGINSDNEGALVGRVFIDYDQNGKLDSASEPGLQHVQLQLDNDRKITADKHGWYKITGLSEGAHTLEVISDMLPITVGLDSHVYQVHVTKGKINHWDLALSFEGGNIKGQLDIQDVQGKTAPLHDLPLVLKNGGGQIVNYTVSDDQGHYEFTNLPLGTYQVALEAQVAASGQYKVLETPTTINFNAIPHRYDALAVIDKQDLKLLKLF